ncbi:hypothetical protein PITCH_A1260068 [uncultured Desulfobacterium sp.]|uniref:Uncharacterized protein n=1 Tax=uncultured Desulfobacterium sp. TaxID=201089 RepID=A0A445MS20_9BACT|nr:hypothetical protein PITCH_A1260068 [uncultured Desulfobacterium sp.]
MTDLAKEIIYGLKRILPSYWPIHPRYRTRFSRPRVVYLLAMPRTGSTLAKRYLGEHEGLVIAPNRTYRHSWKLAKKLGSGLIVIDKRTNNLDEEKLNKIFFDYGNMVWFAGIIRDPRDQLVSLLETERHDKVPRTTEFWTFWMERYGIIFDFAKTHASKGANICLIRYEDLALHPLVIKRDFLRWLGIEVQSEDLTLGYSNVVKEIASGEDDSEDWKTHRNQEVHKESIGRWRHVKDTAAVKLLTHYRQLPEVNQLMCSLGYDEDIIHMTKNFDGITQLGLSLV